MNVLTKPKLSKTPPPSSSRGSDSFDPMAALVAGSGLVRAKRRPRMIGGGIGVLIIGALVGALLISRGGEQRTAIVAGTDIGVGEVITTAQLRVVRIARDTDVRSLPATASDELVDTVAVVPIAKGSLVLPEQVNRTQSAPAGDVLIGAVLDPGALPSPDLRFGDKVRVLIASTTGSADQPSKIVTEAVVWRVWPGQSGIGSRRAVTLAVPEGASVEVGEAAARNSIRLLVVPTATATTPAAVAPAAAATPTGNATPAADVAAARSVVPDPVVGVA